VKIDKYVNKKILILSGIFLAILFLQSMIFMSFDDYGYAALKYVIGNKFNPNGGMDYSTIDILRFLKETYFQWSGRILGQFMLIKSLQIGEWFIKLMQAIIIFITLIMSTKVFCNNENYNKKIVFMTAIFFCIPVSIMKLSLFWYAASTIYFWPFMFFVLGLYLIEREVSKQKKMLILILIFILGIMSGLSQEQVGLAFCSCMFIVILWNYIIKNKLNFSREVLFFVGIVIGYIILIIAPGNVVRMSDRSSGGMLEKNIILVIYNALKMLLPNLILVSKSLIYNFIVAFTIFLLYKRKFKINWIEKSKQLVLVLLLFTQILLLIDISQYHKIVLYGAQISNIIILVMGILMIALLYEDKKLAGLIVASVSSLIPILASPYFVDRMLLPIYVCYVFIFAILLDKTILQDQNNIIGWKKVLCYIILIMGLTGYLCMIYGYFENSIPKNINNKIIKEAKKDIDEGKEISTIYLYRNINEMYTGTQPYELDYTSDIKSCYGIPQKVTMVFELFPVDNPWKALYLVLKGGNEELQRLRSVSEVNAMDNSEDISNLLFGFYNLEKYSDHAFYWAQKETKCNLKNDKITENGLKIILDVPKDNILQANTNLEYIEAKIYINDNFVKNVQLEEGKQEIKVKAQELPKVGDNIYKIELKSQFDFSPNEIGLNSDSRRFFAKIYYIGSDN